MGSDGKGFTLADADYSAIFIAVCEILNRRKPKKADRLAKELEKISGEVFANPSIATTPALKRALECLHEAVKRWKGIYRRN